MSKLINKILIFILIFLSILIIYFSTVGISTSKFNYIINEKLNLYNKSFNLNFSRIKFVLKPFNLLIKAEISDPELLFNEKKIYFEKIVSHISIRSLLSEKILLKNLNFKSKQNDLKNLIKLIRYDKDSIRAIILEKSINTGTAIFQINLDFDEFGKIKKNFKFNGKISNVILYLNKLNLNNNFNFNFNVENNELVFNNVSLEINDQIIKSNNIKVTKNKNEIYRVSGNIYNETNKINLTLFEDHLKKLTKNLSDIISIKFESDFDFNINKKFKISNFESETNIKLINAKFNFENDRFKKIFNSKNIIELNDHNLKVTYNNIGKNSKNNLISIKGSGLYNFNNKNDKIEYLITKKNEDIDIETNIHLKNKKINLDILQFEKNYNIPAILKTKVKINSQKDKIFSYIKLESLENKLFIQNLIINSNNQIVDFNILNLDFTNKNKIINNVNIIKDNDVFQVSGKLLDITNLYNIRNKNNSKKNLFSNNFDPSFIISLKELFIDKGINLTNVKGSSRIKNNNLNSLKINANLEKNKKLSIFINTLNSGEQISTITTDYPKPFIQKYNFIKGFSNGILDLQSVKKDNTTNYVLLIDDFKIKEVPVLAKILTLASLQGISDILTGEGIRFTDFEMKFEQKGELITIEEIYAIGPAISILMSGYIEKEQLVSLRGTLVPATTINKTISTIPVLGDILVGKKIGEGVFGVSFKIKGHPKNLKTSVNPIKTLTPRFITRTLEKIKN